MEAQSLIKKIDFILLIISKNPAMFETEIQLRLAKNLALNGNVVLAQEKFNASCPDYLKCHCESCEK